MHTTLLALAIVAGGAALATVIRLLLAALGRTLDPSTADSRGIAQVVTAGGTVLFWGIIAGALLVALRSLAIPELTGPIDGLLALMPQLMAAVLLVAIGHVGGRLLGDLSARGALVIGERWGLHTARAVHLSILGLAVALALATLGLDLWWLFLALAGLIIVAAAALALTLSQGSVRYVESLIAMQELRSRLTLGARLRIGEVEGRLVETGPTMLVLDTEAGLAHIPASHVERLGMTLLGERLGAREGAREGERDGAE